MNWHSYFTEFKLLSVEFPQNCFYELCHRYIYRLGWRQSRCLALFSIFIEYFKIVYAVEAPVWLWWFYDLPVIQRANMFDRHDIRYIIKSSTIWFNWLQVCDLIECQGFWNPWHWVCDDLVYCNLACTSSVTVLGKWSNIILSDLRRNDFVQRCWLSWHYYSCHLIRWDMVVFQMMRFSLTAVSKFPSPKCHTCEIKNLLSE